MSRVLREGVETGVSGGDHLINLPRLQRIDGPPQHIGTHVRGFFREEVPGRGRIGDHLEHALDPRHDGTRPEDLFGGHQHATRAVASL